MIQKLKISTLLISCFALITINAFSQSISYPETKKVDQVDDYHGISVEDPYRWLEDDQSAETAKWVESQNDVTFKYLNELPCREQLQNRLSNLWNYPKYGTPWKDGNYYFHF